MSKIIKFPTKRADEADYVHPISQKTTPTRECNVIIFPGVRIERHKRTLSQHATALHALRKQAGKTKDT